MNIELTPELIISLTGLLLSTTAILYARIGDARKLESRLTSLETKIEPLWNVINTELPALLIRETTPELDLLLVKHLNPNTILNDSEKTTMIKIIGVEYDKAIEEQNTGHGLGLILLKSAIQTR